MRQTPLPLVRKLFDSDTLCTLHTLGSPPLPPLFRPASCPHSSTVSGQSVWPVSRWCFAMLSAPICNFGKASLVVFRCVLRCLEDSGLKKVPVNSGAWPSSFFTTLFKLHVGSDKSCDSFS